MSEGEIQYQYRNQYPWCQKVLTVLLEALQQHFTALLRMGHRRPMQFLHQFRLHGLRLATPLVIPQQSNDIRSVPGLLGNLANRFAVVVSVLS